MILCGSRVVADRVVVRKSVWSRFVGLMFEPQMVPTLFVKPKPGEVLLHTWFCCSAMDVVFLDGEFRVLKAQGGVLPYKTVDCQDAVKYVLELPFGTIAGVGVKEGEVLLFEEPFIYKGVIL